jgi:cytochrome c oxidase subunit 3
MKAQHYFHLVSPSPWPLFTATSLLFVTLGGALYMHYYALGGKLLVLGLLCLLSCMYLWWRDVVIEGTYQGYHTKIVQQGLRYGVVLFIISEVMFFFSFFWAFFHSSLSPNIELGCIWPPAELKVFNPWEVPLLNTFLLLSSGCTVTWAHYVICLAAPETNLYLEVRDFSKPLFDKVVLKVTGKDRGDREAGNLAFGLTLGLAALFTLFQAYEYFEAPFTILDGVYGSTFFLMTGFHGVHVIVGTLFLTVCAIRNYLGHFSTTHHIGFEAAVWYWHFVDVVWLFLFVVVYYWGGYTI